MPEMFKNNLDVIKGRFEQELQLSFEIPSSIEVLPEANESQNNRDPVARFLAASAPVCAPFSIRTQRM
jgi:hypothetical protein